MRTLKLVLVFGLLMRIVSFLPPMTTANAKSIMDRGQAQKRSTSTQRSSMSEKLVPGHMMANDVGYGKHQALFGKGISAKVQHSSYRT